MGMKRHKTAKKKKRKSLPEKPPKSVAEKEFDYGGIPDRDLKKNLGCG